VISATLKAEVRLKLAPGKSSRPYLKKNKAKMAVSSSVVEGLLSRFETLGFIPSRKEKEKRETEK
jgi:hypothetical protein